MTRQVKALGSSPRPLLFPTPPPPLLLLLLLLAPPLLFFLILRTGDIEKSIRLCFLNWVKPGEPWWVWEVAQPGVDCSYLGSWPRSGKCPDWVRTWCNLGQGSLEGICMVRIRVMHDWWDHSSTE